MKTLSLLAALAALAVFAAIIPACKTSDPNVSQSFGTYDKLVDSTPDKVADAAEAVLKDLQLLKVEKKKTGLDGKVTAKTAQDKPVVIDVKRVGENVTKVEVRVGDFGDEGLSLSILNKIDQKLKK
jgi:Protein of unknown function (DUF3568)